MIRLFALLFVTLLPTIAAAQSEEIVLGLSRDEVAITATFNGSDVLIFGAVKRDAPLPEGGPLEVIITLAGPSEPVTVRRKERILGIWANRDQIEIDAAPSFYAVATSAPMGDALSAVEDLRHNITIPRAVNASGAPSELMDGLAFSNALIRIRAGEGLYQVLDSTIDFEEETLFRGQITLPAALTEGDYAIRIFLTRGGMIVDDYETTIVVYKAGLERWLYETSRNQPLFYGLMSLAIAIAAGWLASAAFRVFQR
ncbi:TIGR02186 family protein [Octadecabacter sp. 1_MG-2023]|uniref:TIGR02186 family protein n=1 Tax=unclassified Octadecabacter TaxID=196158 RepID=UPI001C0A0CFA|nr:MULTISPECIES: TIGR02186 family protein [unclassified Octadecabacter]MBU2991799.1 TIGR02186 family protein [Octadecabacter sp. B2R22]MDO6735772.1 TIGR02186 family protein [Octadecabacter sp. 1_MG-2023]